MSLVTRIAYILYHELLHQHSKHQHRYAIKGIEGTPFYMAPEIVPIPVQKRLHIQFLHRCVEFQYYIVGNDITHKGIQQGEAQVHDVEKIVRGDYRLPMKPVLKLEETDVLLPSVFTSKNTFEAKCGCDSWPEEIANLIGRCWKSKASSSSSSSSSVSSSSSIKNHQSIS